jgi:plasmid stability protein
MDATIRNLDEQMYRDLCARAVMEGRTVREVISEAIRGYLARPMPGRGSLRALKPRRFSQGTERLSSEIDSIVYGSDR